MKKTLKRLFGGFQKRRLGAAGEDEAERFLKNKGYRIIKRNFRTRHGEIDLVALDGDTLVFVEVKTRGSQGFGLPQEAVDRRKRAHITKASRYFLVENPEFEDYHIRFDVVALTIKGENPAIEHIEGAFEVEG